MEAKKVFLIGYMAAGKTTLGKALAAHWGCSFIDLDTAVEAHLGTRIDEAVNTRGELFFRKAEHEVLKSVLQSLPNDAPAVVALGGGTPVFFDHMSLLNDHGETVFLDVPVGELAKRLQGDIHRPLLRNQDDLTEFVAKHMFERRSYYSAAKYRIAGSAIKLKDLLERLD